MIIQEKKDKGDGQLQYEIKLYQSFQGIRTIKLLYQLESQSFMITATRAINSLWLLICSGNLLRICSRNMERSSQLELSFRLASRLLAGYRLSTERDFSIAISKLITSWSEDSRREMLSMLLTLVLLSATETQKQETIYHLRRENLLLEQPDMQASPPILAMNKAARMTLNR